MKPSHSAKAQISRLKLGQTWLFRESGGLRLNSLCPVQDHCRRRGVCFSNLSRDEEAPAIGGHIETSIRSANSRCEQWLRRAVLEARPCCHFHSYDSSVGVQVQQFFAIPPPFRPVSAVVGDLPFPFGAGAFLAKRPARKSRSCPIRRRHTRSIGCQARAFHTIRCIRYAGTTSACDSRRAAASRGRIPSLHPVGNRSGTARRLTTHREACSRPDVGSLLRAAGLRSPCPRKFSCTRRCSQTQRRCGRHRATRSRAPSRRTLNARPPLEHWKEPDVTREPLRIDRRRRPPSVRPARAADSGEGPACRWFPCACRSGRTR